MSRLRAVTLSFLLLVSALAGVLAFGVGSVAATQSGGDTLVVDPNNQCSVSGATEYNTITNAVGNAGSGDTVLVCEGTYQESVTIDQDQDDLTVATYQSGVEMVGNVGTSELPSAFVVDGASGVTITADSNAGNAGFNIADYGTAGIAGNQADGLTVSDTDIVDFDVAADSTAGVSGVRVDNSETVTIQNNRVGNFQVQPGSGFGAGGIAVRDSTDVTIDDNEVGEINQGIGIISNSGDGTEITNNALGNVQIGMGVVDPVDVTVERNALVGYDVGILARQNTASGDSTPELVVTENILDGQDDESNPDSTAIQFQNAGFDSTEPGSDARVYLNVLRDNTEGVQLDSDVADPGGIRFAFNFFLNDDSLTASDLTAIDNDAGAEFEARQNYFGASSGPASVGSGQAIDDADGAVAFDPWLGKNVCSNAQFTGTFDALTSQTDFPSTVGDISSDVDFPSELDSVSLEAAFPVCVWDRAALPLRGTTDSAASVAQLPRIEAKTTSMDQSTDINRRDLVVYQQGESLTLDYSSVSGVADTSQFGNGDVQLLVLEGVGSTSQSDLLTGTALEESTGTATLTTDATSAYVLDDAEGVGQLSSGSITTSYTPQDSGPVAFVLVERTFGDGLTDQNGGDGTVSVQGGIDVIGVTTVPVQEAAADAGLQSSTVTAGNPAEFEPNSNLGSGSGTTHAIAIYDQDAVADGLVRVIVDSSVDDVLAGSVSGSDVAVETSITAVSGTIDFNTPLTVDTTVVGQTLDFTLAEQSSTGEQSLIGDDSVTALPGMTVVDASATSVEGGPQPGTVSVGTDETFEPGTYQYVYLAQLGGGDGSFSTDAGTLTIEEPQQDDDDDTDDGDDGDDDGDGGGGGGAGGGGGGGADVTAPFVVTDASINPDRIAPGETTTVTVTIQNTQANTPLVSRNVIVTVSDDRVATRTVTLNPGERRTLQIPITLTEEGRFTVEANGEFAGLVTVLPENVLERSSSRVFDQDSRTPGVQVNFPRTVVSQITFPEEADGEATVDELRQVPDGIPQPPGTLLTPLRITVPGLLEDQGATVRYEVQRSAIEDANVDPETVQLARWNGDEWTLLETNRTGQTPSALVYESETPEGFSVFAVVGQQATPTDTPTPTPTTPPETPTATPTPETPTDTPTDTASPQGPTDTPGGDGGIPPAGLALGALIIILLIAAAGAALYLSQEGDA